jgi:predicted nucleic acid-binding protein
MAFIIDASATLPWRFADEATPWTEALLGRVETGEEALVPAHWPLEVVNSLLIAQRRGRVTGAQVSEFLEDLAALPIRVVPAAPSAQWTAVLSLAQHYGLTAYDAAYLDLAQRAGLALATLDGDLRKAAVAAGVQAGRLTPDA